MVSLVCVVVALVRALFLKVAAPNCIAALYTVLFVNKVARVSVNVLNRCVKGVCVRTGSEPVCVAGFSGFRSRSGRRGSSGRVGNW